MKDMIRQYSSILETQYKYFEALLQLAHRERELIVKCEVGAIHQVLRDKEELLVNINELEYERRDCSRFFARFFDIPESHMTISYLIDVVDSPFCEQLAEIRADMQRVTSELKEINIRNGILSQQMYKRINEKREIFTSLLSVGSGTYSSKGKANKVKGVSVTV